MVLSLNSTYRLLGELNEKFQLVLNLDLDHIYSTNLIEIDRFQVEIFKFEQTKSQGFSPCVWSVDNRAHKDYEIPKSLKFYIRCLPLKNIQMQLEKQFKNQIRK